MFEPPLPDAGELGLEPSRDNVDRDSTVRVVVNAGDLLGCYSWVPWAGKKSSDDIEFLGIM